MTKEQEQLMVNPDADFQQKLLLREHPQVDASAAETEDELLRQLDQIVERVGRSRAEKAALLANPERARDIIADFKRESERAAIDVEAIIKAEERLFPKKRKRRGVAALRLIEQAQLTLFECERRGDFTQHPVTPGSEFPSIFTRVPIFSPTKIGTAKDLLDEEFSIHFNTGWGRGRKFGPPLTMYDEDTLLALSALRQRQLHGAGAKMPVSVLNPFAPDDITTVQVLYTTISEINRYLQISKNQEAYQRRLASIKRLGATRIEFTRIADKKLNSAIHAETMVTPIVDYLTQEMKRDGCLYIQFPPVMVRWLQESYTYIDMDVRREMSDTGKAIHKFVASQSNINISAEKLKEVCGDPGSQKEFNRKMRASLKKLTELGVLEHEISGNGRSLPLIVTGRRLKKREQIVNN